MNYQRIYDSLISKERNFETNDHYEIHHKIPRSFGGTDEKSNLVRLTPREHYIAHALLLKISESHNDKVMIQKMAYAFNCMKWGSVNGNRNFKFNSRLYQRLKEKYSQVRSDIMRTKNPMSGKVWIHSTQLCQSKRQYSSEPIPEGWSIGRVMDFNKFNENEQLKIKRLERKLMMDEQKAIYADILYEHMKKHGYLNTMKEFNWKASQPALTQFIRKWSISYVPIRQCDRKY